MGGEESAAAAAASSSSSSEGSDGGSLSALSARMRRRFADRDRTLKLIARRNSGHRTYVEFLRAGEEDVRAEARGILETRRWERAEERRVRRERRIRRRAGKAADADAAAAAAASASATDKPPEDGGDPPAEAASEPKASPPPPPPVRRIGPGTRVARTVRFELYHSLPGHTSLVLYCLAHLSFYELVSNSYTELVIRNLGEDWHNLAYGLTFALSLLLTRLTGGLWSWLDEDAYAAVKFDLHNRLRMREIDARVLLWFRRHRRIKMGVDVMALYLCFMTLSYLLSYVLLPAVLGDASGDLVNGLPSIVSGDLCRTRTRELLGPVGGEASGVGGGGGISPSCASVDLSGYEAGRVCYNSGNQIDPTGPYCYNAEELAEALAEEDWVHVASRVSVSSYYALLGDGRASLTRPWELLAFYAGMAALTIGGLFRCGWSFWEMMTH